MFTNLKPFKKTFLTTALLISSLSGCAVAHLPTEEPIPLISQQRPAQRQSNSAVSSTMAATLLGLNATQKQLFDRFGETLRRQNGQFEAPVRNFQQAVRQAFVGNSFNASQLQGRWRQAAGPVEARMATEASLELLAFWKSLGSEQRGKIDSQLVSLKGRWQTEAQATLAKLRQKQEQRLRTISSGIQATGPQQNALKALLIDPKVAYDKQMATRRRFEALHVHLKSNKANGRSVEGHLRTLYNNESYFAPQLTRLQQLHAQLKPAQRQKLVQLLK